MGQAFYCDLLAFAETGACGANAPLLRFVETPAYSLTGVKTDIATYPAIWLEGETDGFLRRFVQHAWSARMVRWE